MFGLAFVFKIEQCFDHLVEAGPRRCMQVSPRLWVLLMPPLMPPLLLLMTFILMLSLGLMALLHLLLAASCAVAAAAAAAAAAVPGMQSRPLGYRTKRVS